MWETEWARPPAEALTVGAFRSRLAPGDIESAYAMLWMEHCIECAIPQCYSTCPLYVARRDRKCARFRNGIVPHPSFHGLFDVGFDVHFRRWGKLESRLAYGAGSPERLRALAERDARAIALVNPVATALQPLDPHRRLNGAYRLFRDRVFERAPRALPRFDAFVVEVWNPSPAPVVLVLEAYQDVLRCRESLRLEPGHNFHHIPFDRLNLDLDRHDGRMLVYPDQDAEARLVFTWLDLVVFTDAARAAVNGAAPNGTPAAAAAAASSNGGAIVSTSVPAPAKQVKCVAWDLDNTVWQGILIEDGAEALTLRPGVLDLVRGLDERGILNTIVSKNDHAQAWAKLTELGIQDYFVSPAINWGQKSANLRAVAEALNVNVDTFVLVDDSAFERSEVAAALPQVRVFAETEIGSLLARPEFDVPISEESRQRRFSYLAEDTRKAIAATFGGGYEAFLVSCAMQAVVYPPLEPAQRDRALELVQRSNQLNLSTRRFSGAEFDALLADPGTLALAFRCRDRYGDYGSVGFMTLEFGGDEPVLRDLVISCRVAKKKVENALFEWLRTALAARGHERLLAWYTPTARNHVLRESLEDAGFRVTSEGTDHTVLELPLGTPVPGGAIVSVEADGVALPDRGDATTPSR